MILHPSRRSFFTGLASLIAAPAIVQVTSLMPVKAVRFPTRAEYEAILQGLLDARMKECEAIFQKAIEDTLLYGQSGYMGPADNGLFTYVDMEGVRHVG